MRGRSGVLPLLAVLLAVRPGGVSAQPESGAAATVTILADENFEAAAPRGKEADAIAGDYVLRNGVIVAVVAAAVAGRDASSTQRAVGGALIDLTGERSANDLLGVYRPGGTFEWSEPEIEPPAGRGRRVSLSFEAPARTGRPAARLRYTIRAGEPWLEVTLELSNNTSRPMTFAPRDRLEVQGPSFDRIDDGVTDIAWFHDPWFGQAYAVIAPDGRLEARREGEDTIITGEGRSTVRLAPGASWSQRRIVFPADSLAALKAIAERRAGTPLDRVALEVSDAAGAPVPGAVVRLDRSGTFWGSARTGSDGRLALDLPAGRYRLGVSSLGYGRRERDLVVPSHVSAPMPITLDSPMRVTGRITDRDGGTTPCRVTFEGLEGTPTPDFGPVDGTAEVKNVIYSADGRFSRPLPPGKYEVTVTRGPEFDLLRQRVELGEDSRAVAVNGVLERSVSTPGWISADFHTHTTSSGDNTTSREGRILSLAAEGVEFAPSTEHNRLESYEPVIRRLDLTRFLGTSTGVELTGEPFAVNHQNAFPLEEHRHRQGGGSPRSDPDPEAQIRRLAEWDGGSDKLVQQNHPDIGWVFYDRDGDGVPDGGYHEMLRYQDAIEAWNPTIYLLRPTIIRKEQLPGGATIEHVENNRVFNWLQLLNQGIRLPGTANTDAHGNYLESGGVRNWVASSTDDPARIDPMEIVHNVEAGHVVMSNGPFIEAALVSVEAPPGALPAHAAIPGDTIDAPGGRVRLFVRVQCPNWIDVDRVYVMVNGRIVPELSFNRYNNDQEFRTEGPIRFEQTMEMDLDRDAHIIVIAAHKEPLMRPLLGPKWGELPPVAITNPIYVDVDGGGFEASGDTLGYPLPVKLDRIDRTP